jgi:hypothetical protein
VYFIQLSDAQGHGGGEYAYRLRVGPRRPDFELRVTPSCINIPAGCSVPICVNVLRRDGFNGEVKLDLRNEPGWSISGMLVPAGRDSIRMTLTAPKKQSDDPVILHLEGSAFIGEQEVTRPAIASEEMMQAFGYKHLVPAEQFLALVIDAKRRWPAFSLASKDPINIPVDGAVQVSVKIPPFLNSLTAIHLELSEAPKGLSLGDMTVKSDNLTFTLKTDGKEIKAGYTDNLIVDVFTEKEIETKAGGSKTKQHIPLGVLPAIPFKIVQK